MAEWQQVGKAELRGFDRQAVELILWAQEQGCQVKVSNRGHAILRGPYGGTTAIARKSKSANRTSKNARAAVARLLRKPD